MLIVLNRLQTNKTPKFIRGLLSFFVYLWTVSEGGSGATLLIHTLDSIQPNLFRMVMEMLLPEFSKIREAHERKIAAIGVVKLLTECPAMLSDAYFGLW